jgi:glycosyltransferase 2 family protein
MALMASTDSKRSADSALADVRNGAATASPPPHEATAELDAPVNLRARFFNVRTLLSFLLGIAILVGLFRYSNVDPGAILTQLQRVDLRIYLLAALSYVLTFPFRGLRWQTLLRNVGARLPLAQLTEVIFISWFVNSVVPGKLGDIYRGYLVKREYGLSLSRTVGTVVAERVVDLLCLIMLLGVSGFFVLRGRVSAELDNIVHLGWIGFAVLIVGMVVTYRFGTRLVSYFPKPVQDVYEKFAHGTFSSLAPRTVPALGLLTVLAWSAEAARLYFVMQSLDLGIGPEAALFTVAAISLALIVPTPGGLGGVETAFVLVLAVFGVDRGVALTVALLDRLISFYSLIIFGFPAFLITKRGR